MPPRIPAPRTLIGWALLVWCLVGLEEPAPAQDEIHHPDHRQPSPAKLARYLDNIVALAAPSPIIEIPEGWFLMGTDRVDGSPYELRTQFDNTELPQRRIWLDAYVIDRNEKSLAEYLAYLQQAGRSPSKELREMIWHVITVHAVPEEVLAKWPAMYVTWEEAAAVCRSLGKRLPTEAEWEKAARGTEGRLFPWGKAEPVEDLANFGAYHVHEIPIVEAVDDGERGESPYGLRHMAGNVAEWVADWFNTDYYPIMPERNPPGPPAGRYRSVRGGSWKSHPEMLRAATRNGAPPDRRSATVGFRCARSGSAAPSSGAE